MEPWPSNCERTAWSISALVIDSCELRLAVQSRQSGDRRRVVAFVRHAGERVFESERADISVAGRQQRTMRGGFLSLIFSGSFSRR